MTLSTVTTASGIAEARREILGEAPEIYHLRHQIELIGRSEAGVVITGATGTGKELVALNLHRASRRRRQPFVALNCAAFPEALIESELFGHERGAFTGADQRHEGRFQAADGGTLFLDEVAELPLTSQAKLLRVLEDGSLRRLGASAQERVDVRVVSATHRDLAALVEAGRFREDFYYRLKTFCIRVPALVERRQDIPLLASHFLAELSEGRARTLSAGALAALLHYDFPGNVRELKHALHHALVLARDETIEACHLPEELLGGRVERFDNVIQPLREAIERFEHQHLSRVLIHTRGRKGEAAALLGISRKTLWAKLRQHSIRIDPGQPELDDLAADIPAT